MSYTKSVCVLSPLFHDLFYSLTRSPHQRPLSRSHRAGHKAPPMSRPRTQRRQETLWRTLWRTSGQRWPTGTRPSQQKTTTILSSLSFEERVEQTIGMFYGCFMFTVNNRESKHFKFYQSGFVIYVKREERNGNYLLTIFVRNQYLVLSSENLMHITLCVQLHIQQVCQNTFTKIPQILLVS